VPQAHKTGITQQRCLRACLIQVKTLAPHLREISDCQADLRRRKLNSAV